jgi:hypothetical protein
MLLQIFYSDHGSTAVEVALKVTSRQSQGPTGGSGEAVARRLEPLLQPPETQWPQTLDHRSASRSLNEVPGLFRQCSFFG